MTEKDTVEVKPLSKTLAPIPPKKRPRNRPGIRQRPKIGTHN